MLWLYLLGLVTFLTIVLRRVLRRQRPLNEELYSKKIAIEHVQSGVAWVSGAGTIGSVNASFAETLQNTTRDLIGREWCKMFPAEQEPDIREAYRQMLLAGVYSFNGAAVRADGTRVWLNVKLVAAHDHKVRFVGHYCLIEDRTRERELEQRLCAMGGRQQQAAPELELLKV